MSMELGQEEFAFESFPTEPRWEANVELKEVTLTARTPVHARQERPENVVETFMKVGKVCQRKVTEDVYVLKELSGVLKAGTSTLLLGPGRSGKSVLMKLLAGQLNQVKGNTLSGSIKFGGLDQKDLQMPRVCSYVGQVDIHLPLLDVKSTLEFAAQCSGGAAPFTGDNPKLPRVDPDVDVDAALKGSVDEVIDKFGLRRCANTVVGNELLKGISGGEKKRVTVAEMMFNRRPVLLCDEITTGLDSSTAFNIVKLLCESAKSMRNVTVMSLLQPSPDLIELFDEVILMCEGQFIYHGPVSKVLDHFKDLGYICPKGRGLGEFLLDMSTHGRRERYLAPAQPHHHLRELVAVSKEKQVLEISNKVGVDYYYLVKYYTKDQRPFALDTWTDYMLVVKRQFVLLYKDRMIVGALVMQVAMISLVSGLLYLNIPLSPDPNSVGLDLKWLSQRLAALFFAVTVYGLNSFAMLPFTLNQRDVYYKHRTNGFFRTFGFVLGNTVTSMLVSALEVVCGSSILFWLVGMVDRQADDAVSTFLVFTLVGYAFNLAIGSIIRLAGFCAGTIVEAVLYAVMVLSSMMLFCGFIILKKDISPWLIWVYWLSPVSWGFRSSAIAVFSSSTFKDQGLTASSLQFMDLPSDEYWIYAGIMFMFGQFAVCVVLQAVVLEYFRFGQPSYVDPGWRIRVNEEIEVESANIEDLDETLPVVLEEDDELEQTQEEEEEEAKEEQEQQQEEEEEIPVAEETIVVQVKDEPVAAKRLWARTEEVWGSFRSFVSKKWYGEESVAAVKPKRLSSRSRASASSKRLSMKSAATRKSRASSKATAVLEDDDMLSQAEEDELDLAQLSSLDDLKDHEAMDTTFCPATLTFENICYTVKLKDRSKKQLLHDISGFALPGKMTALIGSTGAGKTTLLNVLSRRANFGVMSGEILVNGAPVTKSLYRRLLAYVEQEDHHTSNATVKEAITFSAHLRLPRGTTKTFIQQFVREIMETLAITNLANRKIGKKGVGNGLSVQQFKRLSVAVELAANPSILALDEPTSGLSAMEAEIVVAAVRRVARSGRTVICTIHQPSREVYETFDYTIVLQPGGKLVYLGEAQKTMVDYFTTTVAPVANEKKNFLRYNPSSFALEMVLQYSNQVDFPQAYLDSKFKTLVDEEIEATKSKREELQVDEVEVPHLLVRAKYVLERWNLTYWRAFDYNGVRLISMLMIGTFLGLTFFRQNDLTDPGQVSSLVGVLFFATLMLGFMNSLTCLPLLLGEFAVLSRERSSGMYGPVTYIVGSTIAEIPYVLFSTIVSVTILLLLVGVPGSVMMYVTLNVLFFVYFMFSVFVGHFLISITGSVPIATIGATGTTTFLSLFSGFMIALDQVPVYFEWITVISPTRYLTSGFLNALVGCEACSVDPFTAFLSNFTCNNGQPCSQVCGDAPGCSIIAVNTPMGPFRTTAWEFTSTAYGFELVEWYDDLYKIAIAAVLFRIFDVVALYVVKHDKK